MNRRPDARTAHERGQLIAHLVVLLEEIAQDPSVPKGYRDEARRLVDEADAEWGAR